MKPIHLTTIQFPEIHLKTRDAHKLRGYFGRIFREQSPLLHNHLEDGSLRYKYPLVQYKVIQKVPCLVGLCEGAELLTGLFLQVKELHLEDQTYPLHTKNIRSTMWEPGIGDDLYTYNFETLWMALNQHNYQAYRKETTDGRARHLKSILIGNLLSFLKGMEIRLADDQRLLAQLRVNEQHTQFKDRKMMAFSGTFTTNILLPDYIGLGKSVSRGYGAIVRIQRP